MHTIVSTCQAHAHQCTTAFCRHSHQHTCTMHCGVLTMADTPTVSHHCTDYSAPPEPATASSIHPACIPLLVHVKHMRSKAQQLPFPDTRISIHARCTIWYLPRPTHVSAPTTALLQSLPPRRRRNLHANNCQYMSSTCTAKHTYHF
jgi:hypothetical protein